MRIADRHPLLPNRASVRSGIDEVTTLMEARRLNV